MAPHSHSNLLYSTCASLLSLFSMKPPVFTILSICQLLQASTAIPDEREVSSRAGTEIVAVWLEVESGKVILHVCAHDRIPTY